MIGGGRSGLAAARMLRALGAKVLLSDSRAQRIPLPRGIHGEFGGHSKRLLECLLIIRSPGVSSHLPILQQIHQRGIPVWSEVELASQFARATQQIAITGTNGKTTTTTLVGEFFRAWKGKVFVGGNIGTPWADRALTLPATVPAILEISSYQLEDIHAFHPTISSVLNITPDHLEHHGSMRAYAAAKARIFENQTRADVCVLNAEDAWCRTLSKRCAASIFWFSGSKPLKQGIWLDTASQQVHVRWRRINTSWPLVTHLPGPHNVENILAGAAMGIAAGMPISVIRRVLKRFQGVEHRLECVRTLRGARYINDSKATNVDSTRVALASFKEPLVLIMGGEGKGAPYTPLARAVRRQVKSLLVIGEDTLTIAKTFERLVPLEKLKTLDRAVRRAAAIAREGDVVLLSPACASFDQYRNYEERGRHFKSLVRKLR